VATHPRSRLRLKLPMNVRRVFFIEHVKVMVEARTDLLNYRLFVVKVPQFGYWVPCAGVKSPIVIMRGVLAVPSVVKGRNSKGDPVKIKYLSKSVEKYEESVASGVN